MAWTTIETTRNYFGASGINLHFQWGEEIESTTYYIHEDATLESREHDFPFAIYGVFGRLPNLGTFKGGWSDSQAGIRLNSLNRWWQGYEDKAFGHEIFHCLGLDEDYTRSPDNNYMNDKLPIYLDYCIQQQDWDFVKLTSKWSTATMWPLFDSPEWRAITQD